MNAVPAGDGLGVGVDQATLDAVNAGDMTVEDAATMAGVDPSVIDAALSDTAVLSDQAIVDANTVPLDSHQQRLAAREAQLAPRWPSSAHLSNGSVTRFNVGLLGSMGSIGDAFDNAVADGFFGTLQLELLDEHHRDTRDQLANAIFDWIECWYNPRRRPSYCGRLSPIDYETATAA
jgi:transposase InsO family protein